MVFKKNRGGQREGSGRHVDPEAASATATEEEKMLYYREKQAEYRGQDSTPKKSYMPVNSVPNPSFHL